MKKYITPETDTFRLELSECIALSDGDTVNKTVGDDDTYSKGAANWETEESSGW